MPTNMKYRPLAEEEVCSVIEGRGAASRIPVHLDLWVHEKNFGDQESQVRNIIKKYPSDIMTIGFRMPDIYDAPGDDPGYRWLNHDEPEGYLNSGLDERGSIKNWTELDGILEDFPDPHYKGLFPDNPEPDGRYRLGIWWFNLFERHWMLRGMTNSLMDFYTDPDSVHRLYEALTDFYIAAITRAKAELNIHGVFTSDDLGTQNGTFFSPEIFERFYVPYYRKLINAAHSLGLHFWLHTCGCIEKFLPRLIELGLDVIHPIQKYTMDERTIAEKYGADICIWAGFDVQKTIPLGTADDVRKEVQFMFDTYYRPEGRLMFTAGNGINEDCPLSSLEALYDEAYSYGLKICSKKR